MQEHVHHHPLHPNWERKGVPEFPCTNGTKFILFEKFKILEPKRFVLWVARQMFGVDANQRLGLLPIWLQIERMNDVVVFVLLVDWIWNFDSCIARWKASDTRIEIIWMNEFEFSLSFCYLLIYFQKTNGN